MAKTTKPTSTPTTAQSLGALLKSARDIRRKDEGLEVNALEVTLPAMGDGRPDTPLVVSLPVARCTTDTIASFKSVLAAHPGTAEVHLRLIGNGSSKVMRLDDSLRVAQSSSLIADLKELLGPNCLS